MKRKNKIAALIAGLTVLTLAGGTFAYFKETITVANRLATKSDGAEMIEKFTPDMDWQPGESIVKNVWVNNTGNHELLARVRWEEQWYTDKGYTDKFGAGITSENDSASLVDKTYASDFSSDWVAGTGGWYYYNGTVTDRVQFLDSITLRDEGFTNEVSYYYTTGDNEPATLDGWIHVSSEADIPSDATYKKVVSIPAADSYANKYYQLTMITEVLTASQKAVEDTADWNEFKGLCSNTYEGLPETTANTVTR